MEFEIKFLNWREWQGRGTEHDKTHWFKVPNDIHYHALWDKLSGAQFKCFILLCAEASRKSPRSGHFRMSFSRCRAKFGLDLRTVHSTLTHTLDLGILKYQELTEQNRESEVPRSDKIRRDQIRKEVLISKEDRITQQPSSSTVPTFGPAFLKNISDSEKPVSRVQKIVNEMRLKHPEWYAGEKQ